MIKAKTTVVIQKPVAEVFKFIGADYVQNHPKWDARCVKTDMKGPVAKGATGVETRKEAQRVFDADPRLARPEHGLLRDEMARRMPGGLAEAS